MAALLGGVLLVPLAVAVEGRPPALTGGNVVGFAYLSLVGTALAFLLWFEGIRRLPPPRRRSPRPRRAGHRRAAGLGDPRPVAVADPARRLRLTLGAIAYGALLGAPAEVGEDRLREDPDRGCAWRRR